MYCDVVNVQPHFHFSDEIIILNLEYSACMHAVHVCGVCVHAVEDKSA